MTGPARCRDDDDAPLLDDSLAKLNPEQRVGKLIGETVVAMQLLGTFHSIGAKMLRRRAELVGLKGDFTILDTDDQIRLMKQIITAETSL